MFLCQTGERLVTVGDDGTMRVWDSKTGDLLAAIEAHKGAATSIRYSPKQDLVVTTGIDRAVDVWDLSYTVPDPKALSQRVATIASVQIEHDQLIPATVKPPRAQR